MSRPGVRSYRGIECHCSRGSGSAATVVSIVTVVAARRLLLQRECGINVDLVGPMPASRPGLRVALGIRFVPVAGGG